MPDPSEHADADRPLGAEEAAGLAEAMRAFGSSSRLRLLWALLDGERPVEQLAAAVAMEQSAVSHQLPLLRQLRLVAAPPPGRPAPPPPVDPPPPPPPPALPPPPPHPPRP